MPDQPETKTLEKNVVCAHCGAENPPGLLMCLECGREPISGRDLFAPPEIPGQWESSSSPELSISLPDPIQVPDPLPIPMPEQLSSYPELSISLPDPIQVPDPLPIPTLEDFAAPPPQPPPVAPPVYIAPPPEPRNLAPVLGSGLRWVLGLMGLPVVTFLGLGTAASLASLNLPGGMCLGSLALMAAVLWLGMVTAQGGESRSTASGARRRLVTALGQRLFEVTPGATKEQAARLPIIQVPPLSQPASHLIYLNSSGDRASQLTQVLLGTLCALVASDHIRLASQTYQVLTASPLGKKLETIRRVTVSSRTLYVGAGYLEKLILQQARRTDTASIRDLVAGVLRQAGADLLDQIADSSGQSPIAEDLNAQLAALGEFCQELMALNPELYEQLSQEVEEAVRRFSRAA
ncbi:MAG: hypothetical protein Kow0063_21790 [Anaerolineae bacterium]